MGWDEVQSRQKAQKDLKVMQESQVSQAHRSHVYHRTLCWVLILVVGLCGSRPQLEVLGDVQCQPVSQLKFVLDAMHQVPHLRTGTQLVSVETWR